MYSLKGKYFDPDAAINSCVSRCRCELEKAISLDKSEFNSMKDNYRLLAEKNELFSIKLHTEVKPHFRNLYEDIYTKSLGSERATESDIRQEILDKAKASKCPYCGANFVTDVDHFLPVSKFFRFSVLTYNLVPSCHPCNKKKSSKCGTSLESSFFHPYFEDIDHIKWIDCEVSFDGRMKIDFIPSKKIDEALSKRIGNFRKELGISKTWKTHAASFLSTKRPNLINIFNNKGGDKLREYMQHCLNESLSEEFSRSNWRTALIEAILENEEFFSIKGLQSIPSTS